MNVRELTYPEGYAVTGARVIILVNDGNRQVARDFPYVPTESEKQKAIEELKEKLCPKLP